MPTAPNRNPVAKRGLFLSELQFELVKAGLLTVAQIPEKKGDHRTVQEILATVSKLEAATVRGPQTLENMGPGAFLSQQELEYVQAGLVAFAAMCQKRNDAETAQSCTDLGLWFEQMYRAGEGPSEAMVECFQADFRAARSATRQAQLLNDFLALLARTCPDPGGVIAPILVQMHAQAITETTMKDMGPALLRPFIAGLRDEMKGYEAENKWPSGKAVYEHVIDLVEYGVERTTAGKTPWDDDAPSEAAS
jgi:hypothetical protein